MKQVAWVLLLAIAAGVGYWLWYGQRRWSERQRAEEERFADFMAQVVSTPKPRNAAAASAVSDPGEPGALETQKLLFEAAHKAGEAGEPALAIQLYGRLLARYPGTAFAEQARASVEVQKRKLSKA